MPHEKWLTRDYFFVASDRISIGLESPSITFQSHFDKWLQRSKVENQPMNPKHTFKMALAKFSFFRLDGQSKNTRDFTISLNCGSKSPKNIEIRSRDED